MESARKAKAPSSVRIERAKNGGFMVHHSYDNSGAGESYRMPETHVFKDHAAMMAHVGKHMEGREEPESKAEAAGADVDDKPNAMKAAPTKAEGRKAAATKGRGVD